MVGRSVALVEFSPQRAHLTRSTQKSILARESCAYRTSSTTGYRILRFLLFAFFSFFLLNSIRFLRLDTCNLFLICCTVAATTTHGIASVTTGILDSTRLGPYPTLT